MSDSVIRVEGLGKKYVLGHQAEGRSQYKSLRDVVADGARSMFRGRSPESRAKDEFWALRDVDFEIRQGDRVGIIGRNGAGKSTLLKVLSRIVEPTTGRIGIKGRVASLLEVGTGFHPELTGRENIYLNGAILGMSRREIDRKFDEIVAFAEVERFLDTPVKRYSSGMYVRLAFAVAAHLEPEILIVDEVLAVGDAQFQKKCLGKMEDVAGEGRTVLFVSHNMNAMRALCPKGIILNKGELLGSSSMEKCIEIYESNNFKDKDSLWTRNNSFKDKPLMFTSINSKITGKQPNLSLELEIGLQSTESHQPCFLAVDIVDSSSVGVMQAIPTQECFLNSSKQEHLVKLSVCLPPMIPGQYFITAWTGSHYTITLDEVKEVVMFEIKDSPTIGRTIQHTKDHGYVVPNSSFTLSDYSRTVETCSLST